MNRILRWLLGLSVAANAIIVALLWQRAAAPAPFAAGSASVSAPEGTPASRAGVALSNAATSTSPAPVATIAGTPWSALQSNDLKTLVAHLRAAGFPPKVVAAIVVSAVSERFTAREQDVFYGVDPKEYWKPGGAGGGIMLDDPKKREAYDQLWRDRSDMLQSLLGEDWEMQDEESLAYSRRRYGNLSQEKLIALNAIFRGDQDRRRQVVPSGRTPLPEEAEKLTTLDRQMRDDMAKVLTPAELEQYDLRNGPTANYLRYNSLPGFGPDEAEYRALFGIFQPFVAQYERPYGARPLTREEQDARDSAAKQLEPAIAATLGPERFADWQQAQKPEYRQLNQLVARLDLPIAVARDVAAVQSDIVARAAILRGDASLAADQRTAQLAALAEEATAKVTAKLGAKGFVAYKEYGGQWVQNLTARPPVRK
jgi:hypothetical protein